MRVRLPILFIVIALASASCKRGHDEAPADTDAHVDLRTFPSGAPAHLFDGGVCPSAPACNAIVNGARTVTVMEYGGSLPGFNGGAITDGTYFLTGASSFNSGAAGRKLRMTMIIRGDAIDVAQDGDCQNATRHGTFKASGKTLDLDFTCPAALKDGAYFTSSGTELSYTDSSGAFGVVYTFTKQP